MPESPVPSPQPPLPDTRRWWGAWLLSTMLLPSVAGALLPVGVMYTEIFTLLLVLVLVCASLGLHVGACIRLAPEIAALAFLLAVGGWVLMAASFFAGCVLMVIR